MTYLDYASTTPVDQEVYTAILSYFRQDFGKGVLVSSLPHTPFSMQEKGVTRLVIIEMKPSPKHEYLKLN